MGRFFRYFAYGSNMHPVRLGLRTPSCRVLGNASIARHTLRFHKRSMTPGHVSGKCDAHYTGRASDVVHGVLYEVHVHERRHLDEAEGAGTGYHGVDLSVTIEDESKEAYSFVADKSWIDGSLLPYDWYVAIVSSGARIHGLPMEYQARLRSVPSIPDPDRKRAERYFDIARGTRKIRPIFKKPRG
ncbi:MAG: gamma-glutamylcyclotransferase [Gammaproteobacteria bacterium]|nr:MAG: gamma-glutamylcyclotransferase [Gammaproteobacteria bacterium]